MQTPHTEIDFIDTNFADPAAKNYLADAIWRPHRRFNPSCNPNRVEHRSQHSILWTTNFEIKDSLGEPFANAEITIKDKDGEEVFSGAVDGAGELSLNMAELRIAGDQKEEFNPYLLIVDSASTTTNAIFTADRVQTIVVTEGDVADTTPPSVPSAFRFE